MAVAVKNASEAPTHSALDRLAVSSLLGVVYVLGSIGIVFYALPAIWGNGPFANSFVNGGLLILLMVVGAGALVVTGARLTGSHPPHGLRAGIGVGILSLFAIGFFTWAFGTILESMLGGGSMVGGVLTILFGVGLLYAFGRIFFRPSFEDTLGAIEDQGWFSRTVYKGSQGQRVRRGTMLGVLILVGCGIYTLLTHNALRDAGYRAVDSDLKSFVNDWAVKVPFVEMHQALPDGEQTTVYMLTILRDVRFTLPLLLALAGLWFAFRVVNWPTFADFLIATEAEMNKVSWTTRKRLWQDTIVVLTTLVMMTVFLMVVDLFWGWALHKVKVLRISDNQKALVQKETDW